MVLGPAGRPEPGKSGAEPEGTRGWWRTEETLLPPTGAGRGARAQQRKEGASSGAVLRGGSGSRWYFSNRFGVWGPGIWLGGGVCPARRRCWAGGAFLHPGTAWLLRAQPRGQTQAGVGSASLHPSSYFDVLGTRCGVGHLDKSRAGVGWGLKAPLGAGCSWAHRMLTAVWFEFGFFTLEPYRVVLGASHSWLRSGMTPGDSGDQMQARCPLDSLSSPPCLYLNKGCSITIRLGETVLMHQYRQVKHVDKKLERTLSLSLAAST